MNTQKHIQYADDDYESVTTLFKLRAPSLAIGLILGIGISFIISNFEKVLSQNVQLAYFVPFVVYIAAAVGTQTEAIYSRDLKTGNTKFANYLRKESALGIIFGLLFGAIAGGIVFMWLEDLLIAKTVAVASFIAIATAPIVALIVTQTFQYFHKDPAVGSGPVGTVIQDMTSVLIYGLVASLIML